ncbi:MAG: hypothetical protein MZU97_24350 [Bacillus subtilis]|nr:hypothetical protein [Bacillus subtilis]
MLFVSRFKAHSTLGAGQAYIFGLTTTTVSTYVRKTFPDLLHRGRSCPIDDNRTDRLERLQLACQLTKVTTAMALRVDVEAFMNGDA